MSEYNYGTLIKILWADSVRQSTTNEINVMYAL